MHTNVTLMGHVLTYYSRLELLKKEKVFGWSFPLMHCSKGLKWL